MDSTKNVISTEEIIERLRSRLPMAVRLADSTSGEPFEVHRDNMLALLVVDATNLVLEAQTCAMLYGEMARISAAARLASKQADVRFRQWKARIAAEGREKLDNGLDAKGNKKSPTGEQIEEYYRLHSDYDSEYLRANKAEVFVSLTDDLKEAYRMKQYLIGHLHSMLYGQHERVQHADERLREMSTEGEESLTEMMQESAAQLASYRAGKGIAPPEKEGGKKPKRVKGE